MRQWNSRISTFWKRLSKSWFMRLSSSKFLELTILKRPHQSSKTGVSEKSQLLELNSCRIWSMVAKVKLSIIRELIARLGMIRALSTRVLSLREASLAKTLKETTTVNSWNLSWAKGLLKNVSTQAIWTLLGFQVHPRSCFWNDSCIWKHPLTMIKPWTLSRSR